MTTRENVIEIFNAAVESVQPKHLLPAYLFIEQDSLHILEQQFDVNSTPNIYVIGAGKATAAMAEATENIIGNLITEGFVVTKYGHSIPLKKTKCLEAAHPVPDENSLAATEEMIRLLKTVNKDDIVICLISGGASSLWADLPAGSSLPALQDMFTLLLKSGADIKEVNAVRKHLSAVKGGQLLRYAPDANWFTFIISDVPGDKLDVIASGPTVPDVSTFADVKLILDKYALTDQLPSSILQHINDGIKGIIAETLKENEPIFNRVHNKIIGNNSIALEAAAERAKALGYHIHFIEKDLNGDAATVGREFTHSCKKYAGVKPACFLLGGETTVTVKGAGKGGRNQHLALSALCELSNVSEPNNSNKITFLAAGTDGTDGPTDASGAITDSEVLVKAIEQQLDPAKYLEDNDAYHFFDQVGGLLKTGATQTNVMDLVVVIVE